MPKTLTGALGSMWEADAGEVTTEYRGGNWTDYRWDGDGDGVSNGDKKRTHFWRQHKAFLRKLQQQRIG